MPRGDRTGPQGRGPLTGRRLGLCAGNDRPGFQQPAWGGGYGRGNQGYGRGRGGMGYGRGYGNRGYYPPYYAPGPMQVGPAPVYPALTKEQQVEDLNRTKEYLQSQLEDLSKEIERLAKNE